MDKENRIMKVGFFEICFECNAIAFECSKCNYVSECGRFMHLFSTMPNFKWSELTSIEEIEQCIIEWEEYNNGKTDEH